MLAERTAEQESKTDIRLVVSCQKFFLPLDKDCETNATASFLKTLKANSLVDAELAVRSSSVNQ